MTRRNAAIDTTYGTFADDRDYDLYRIKHAAGVLIDRVLKSFIDTDTEEAAYRLRELIDDDSRRHAVVSVHDAGDDCEF